MSTAILAAAPAGGAFASADVPDNASCVGWSMSYYASGTEFNIGQEVVPFFKAIADGPFGGVVSGAAQVAPADDPASPCAVG